MLCGMLADVLIDGFDDMLLVKSTELFGVNIFEPFFAFVFINKRFHFDAISFEPKNHFFEEFSLLHRHQHMLLSFSRVKNHLNELVNAQILARKQCQ